MKTEGQKFYRYMSNEEFQKLSSGMELTNENMHKTARTASEGFCFLPEVVKFNSYFEDEVVSTTFNPVQCYRFLSGIVTNDVLVEFENVSEDLQESFGIYADPINCDYYATIDIVEYCAKSYSRDTMRPTRYAIVGEYYHQGVDWYTFN